jgi:hypothetical protein
VPHHLGEKNRMYETHLALIVALIAAVIAMRRQRRLPTFRLEWDNISANIVYAKRFVVESGMELYIDEKGRPTIEFPYDIVDGESWRTSVRCGHGLGGFRVEFILSPPDDLPHQYLAVAFGASPTSPAQVSIFDANDALVAKLP